MPTRRRSPFADLRQDGAHLPWAAARDAPQWAGPCGSRTSRPTLKRACHGHAPGTAPRPPPAASRPAEPAAHGAAGDPVAQATVRAVLAGLGEFARLGVQPMALDEQANQPAGAAPGTVIAVCRQATALGRLERLPPAYELTLGG